MVHILTQLTFSCSKPTKETLEEGVKYRHFNHVTKSRVFKNLDLREKADRNFRRTFLKNRFRHLKLYSNPPS